MTDTQARPHIAPTDATFRALIRTYGMIQRVMQRYFLRHGISASQWAVLRVLYRAERDGHGGLRLTDLSDRLLIRPPSVTGVVDRLQRLGLVSRSAARDDLRAKHVRLTPAGQTLVERVLQGHAAQMQSVLGGLSPEEQTHLHQLLDQMCSHLEALDEHETVR